MKSHKFGSTGISIGPVALGTVNFSALTDEPTSFRILDAAKERGINFVDTANNYNAGRTEELIGRWFARGGGRREATVLATKVFNPPMEFTSSDPVRRSGSWVGPNDRGLSARHIREACEASLRRLGTDRIDVYQMHHVDRGTRWEEVWQAMELLVAQGKVLYVGSSNFAGWHIAQAQEIAKRRDFLGLVSEQSVYNLMKRSVELEVLPACEAYGMAFLSYSPLAAGALAGMSDDGVSGRRSGKASALQGSPALAGFGALCAGLGHPPSDIALAWLASRPGVTPIIGPRTFEQFESDASAVEIPLPDETLAELDRIFPGPGGPAPEAYAW